MAAPSMKGKNATVKLFIDSEVVDALDVKSWDLEPNVTEIADGVCGEDRDRLDREVNFFKLTLECFNVNTKKIEKLLSDIENDDTGVQPLSKAFGIVLKPNDGSKKAFVSGGDMTIDAWKLAFSGRVERGMLSIPIRVQYFKAAAGL